MLETVYFCLQVGVMLYSSCVEWVNETVIIAIIS